MLICRDGLLARPFPATQDLQSQPSSKSSRPTPSFVASPLVPHHETMEKAKLDEEAINILTKAMNNPGTSDEWRTKTWLEFQHVTTTAI